MATITAVDMDVPPQTVSFSLAALEDFALFTLTPGGVLTFNSPPDAEAPADLDGDNVYELTLLASDGEMSVLQNISIIVSQANDNPFVFTSPANVSVSQGTSAVLTVTAADADKPGNPVTYTIVGGADQAKFGITAGGVLSFLIPPSVAMPMDANGDNVYEVMVKAVDEDTQMATQAITIAVVGAPLDFGDAPDTAPGTRPGNYQTILSDNGPRHSILPGLRLGTTIDGDNGVLQNSAAIADDVDGELPDDEDGLVNPALDLWVTAGAQPTVNVRVTNTTGTAATLYGWIDYNANGVFENATERASVAVPNGTNNGIVTLAFPAVPAASRATTYARFRLSTDAARPIRRATAVGRRSGRLPATITRPSNGTADSAKNKKIASGTNGGRRSPTATCSAARWLARRPGWRRRCRPGRREHQCNSARSSGGEVYVLFMNANGTVKSKPEDWQRHRRRAERCAGRLLRALGGIAGRPGRRRRYLIWPSEPIRTTPADTTAVRCTCCS